VKIYNTGDLEVVALQGLTLDVARAERLALVGASGSGKTTLLNLLGGLDRPSAGQLLVGGQELLKLSESRLDHYRRQQVGFVWQQPERNLLPALSVLRNLTLPMMLAGQGRRARRRWAQELLEGVGLWDVRGALPVQLSGGQQQRVAIAVALANRPHLLLADEPTGALDSITAGDVLALLRALNERYGITLVLVTHDAEVAGSVGRRLTLRDGRVSSEAVRRQPRSGALFEEFAVVDAAGRVQLPAALLQASGIDRRARLEAGDRRIVIRPVEEDAT
jgi:ABC-type lipoprotein export system ATPase subunit